MKNTLALLLLLSLMTYGLEWKFADSDCGWKPGNGLKTAITSEALVLEVTADHPALTLAKAGFAPDTGDNLVVMYKAEGTHKSTHGFLFFGTETVPEFNEAAKFYVPSIIADGREHMLTISLNNPPGVAKWPEAKTITSLRLDMVDTFRGKISIRSIAVLKDGQMRAYRGWPAVDAREWTFKNTNAGWEGTRNLTATETEDGLLLEPYDMYPNISIGNIRMTTKGADIMAVTYKSRNLPDRTGGFFFFGTDSVPKFNEGAKFYVGSLISDWREHTLFIPMSGPGTVPWRDAKYISSIRFDLVCDKVGQILLKSIRYISNKEYAEIRAQKYAQLGIPFKTKVEIPDKAPYLETRGKEEAAYQFTSPMCAPEGAFDYVGMNYLRMDFELKEPPARNLLQTMCDDQVEALYLNGRHVQQEWSNHWSVVNGISIPRDYFKAGRNVLAVQYQNTGSIGGIMLDLQVVDADGKYQVFPVNKGVGIAKAAPEGWQDVDFACDWKPVASRPGPPSPPWSNVVPQYETLEAPDGTVEIRHAVHDDMTADVTFVGKPALTAADKFYYRIKDSKGVTLSGKSGTMGEWGVKAAADGSVTIHFTAYDEPLYGSAQRGSWEFGVFRRRPLGDNYKPAYIFKERSFPGKSAVMKIKRTNEGPIPMLNGKPFYFNILTNQHFTSRGTVPSGMDGKDSPMNVVAFRAGGSSPHAQWWLGPDTYDFSGIDRSCSQLLSWFPDSMLGIYVWCHPGKWYDKAYPERISRAHDMSQFGYYVSTVSFSNKDVQADAARAVAALVEHCEKYFGSRIVLYNLMGGISCEWQGWQSHTDKLADYSELAQKDFVEYAAKRGVKVAGTPTFEERTRGDIGYFRNPAADKAAILYERYYSDSIADCILGIAKAVKQKCHNNKLVGCYYGYHQEYANLSYCVNAGGHNSTQALLASSSIDFLLSPQSYGIRSLGAPNADMKPYGSIRAAGKFSIIEDDVRTHLLPATGYDQTLNMEHTLAVFKRNQGMALSRKMPMNQLPLVGGYELNAPEIRDVFARSLKVGQYLMEAKESPVPEIGVVIDEEALRFLKATRDNVTIPKFSSYQYLHNGMLNERDFHTQPLTGELLYFQRIPLAQIGASVDVIMLDDVVRLSNKYKLVVFLNCFENSPSLREAVNVLRHRKVKMMMVYGTGFIGNQRLGVSAMSRLSCMEMEQLGKGSLQFAYKDDGGVFGNSYAVEPRFSVSDKDATVLASYCDNGKPAIAEKDNVIFYGCPLLDASFLREVARKCGVHIYSETGDNLHAGGGIVTIHANHAGQKSIKLPKRSDVVDIYSGEVVARDVDSFTFDMKAFESRVFLCGPADKILKVINSKQKSN